MDGVLVQHGIGDCAELLRLSESRHAKYCERHALRFVQSFERLRPERLPYWEKVPLIHQTLLEAPKDALVVYGDGDILIEGKEDIRGAMPAECDMAMYFTNYGKMYNAGVIVMRNRPVVREFFERVDVEGPVPEDELQLGVGKHDEARINRVLKEMREAGALKFHDLEARWNCHSERCEDPQIRAWHGVPNVVVRRFMAERLFKLAKDGR